jgi:UDPglucose--hexose-1-phosphate uridylyltransferase
MDWKQFNQLPQRRLNPLLGEWVMVSPQRTDRPWQGQVEAPVVEDLPSFDPECYLCPGNPRAQGARNPAYTSTFVFENDFPAMRPETPPGRFERDGLLLAETEPGVCRVVCFSPRHNLTMARMNSDELRAVVDVWAEQFAELEAIPGIRYVQIFENRGAMMGASNPHPHCQIWANASLPNVPAREQAALGSHRAKRGECMLCRYLALERELGERVVCENAAFVALVPFWAVWPFEIMLLSRRHVTAISDFDFAERDLLGDILRRVSIRYDNLFAASFPNSMGFHQRPTDGEEHPEWHLHLHFFPPLLRSATIRKFSVGYEMLAMPQRDISPEAAAVRLREAGEVHYRDRPPPK